MPLAQPQSAPSVAVVTSALSESAPSQPLTVHRRQSPGTDTRHGKDQVKDLERDVQQDDGRGYVSVR